MVTGLQVHPLAQRATRPGATRRGWERAPLMVTGRRLLGGVLAATALGWAAVGWVLALMSVLPTPNLGCQAGVVLWLLAVFVEGYSVLLAAFALLGVALAVLARRVGFRRTSLAAAVLGAV